MSDGDYRRALDEATRECERLLAQRAAVDERLAQLTQTIAGLMRLCHLTPTVPLGLTDACRLVLKASAQPLVAVEVRAQLEAIGFDLTRYANVLAVIHTVLRRLNEAGEVRFIPQPYGKPAYQWNAGVRTAVISERERDALVTGGLSPQPRRRPRDGKEKP